MRENCEECGRRAAAITFTEIGQAGKRAAKLCLACAEASGVPVSPTLENLEGTETLWDDLLHNLSQDRDREDSLACPGCGWTFADFEARGKLGCPQCYQTFMGDMTRLLKEFHGFNRHTGKIPYSIGRRIDVRRQILGVKEDIQFAISEERFEDAAHLRDEMRDLEIELTRLADGADAT
jgi:protein arginine kinase activator